MTISPDVRWASSLVYTLHLHPDTTPMQLHEAQQRWNQSHAEPLAAQVPVHRNDPNSGRRLRIGYVGTNFRLHPQSSFILPMLAAHDRAHFEIFCYANVEEPDAVSEQARKLVDQWRGIAMLSDQQAAELVTRDHIDILVDLDMHSPGNRLLVFARKPAPVQVSAFAYPGTTGMCAVDYRVTEAADGSEEQFYSERAIHLSEGAFCYAAAAQDSPASKPPAQANGFVTFGYLGDFSRITSQTIDLWAGALRKLERSRLLVAGPRGSCRQRLIDAVAQLGVTHDRIDFVDTKVRPGNLDLHYRIDVALDTFPWNGRMTTLDAIWNGVPVITLCGQRGVSRIGSAILSRLRLEDMVARSPEEFATIAARVGVNQSELVQLQSSLRKRLETSPLMDSLRFTRNLESAYRQIWTAWCSIQGRQGPVTASSL